MSAIYIIWDKYWGIRIHLHTCTKYINICSICIRIDSTYKIINRILCREWYRSIKVDLMRRLNHKINNWRNYNLEINEKTSETVFNRFLILRLDIEIIQDIDIERIFYLIRPWDIIDNYSQTDQSYRPIAPIFKNAFCEINREQIRRIATFYISTRRMNSLPFPRQQN